MSKMSLRDQLAIHCPKEIPEWFEPSISQKPSRPSYANRLVHIVYESGMSIDLMERDNEIPYISTEIVCEYSAGRPVNSYGYLLSSYDAEKINKLEKEERAALLKELITYNNLMYRYKGQIEEWTNEYNTSRLSQWPYYYADLVLSKGRVREDV